MHQVQVVAPAATSLVTTAELSNHLLLFGDTSYDDELQGILLQAEDYISGFLGEYLVSTTVRERVFGWGDIHLAHKNPSNLVVSYYDGTNTPQVFNAANYVLDLSGEYPVIKFKTTPPTPSTDLTFQGYVTYDTALPVVPAAIKRAVLMVAAELFEHRSDSSEKKAERAHLTAMRLLQKHRRWGV